MDFRVDTKSSKNILIPNRTYGKSDWFVLDVGHNMGINQQNPSTIWLCRTKRDAGYAVQKLFGVAIRKMYLF